MSSAWEAVIGLEIHVQLNTQTKMFCGCPVGFGGEPNTRVCPVCLGHPGTLPVINEKAVEYATRIALALDCRIAGHTLFHRKNYFYPDLPKGYQISQYDLPLGDPGHLEVQMDGGSPFSVGITRVHIEEDAGTLVHTGAVSGRIDGADYSLVDFNRGGTPLVEIVTEPDLSSPERARVFLTQLRSLIEHLGVSDVNMEEGSLRCDANVSVRRHGEALGVKTELKNMNSFRFLQRGLESEIVRQIELLESGETVEQATVHFDPQTGQISTLRSKEEAHDYRYFPEPDLVSIELDEAYVEKVRRDLLELVADGTLSGKMAKKVFTIMISSDSSAAEIVEEEGLGQISDEGALEEMVVEIIAANPEAVEEFGQGRSKILGFFVGQAMKKTKGQANPQLVNELFRRHLQRSL